MNKISNPGIGGVVESGNSSEALATMQLIYKIYYADSCWRNAHGITNPNKKCKANSKQKEMAATKENI